MHAVALLDNAFCYIFTRFTLLPAELNKDIPEQRLHRLTEAWHRAQQAIQAEVGRTQHDWGARLQASGESTAARTRIRGELQQLLDEVGAELVAQYAPTTNDPEYRKQVVHEKKETDDLAATIQSEMGKEETLTREIDRDSPQPVGAAN